MRAFAMIAGNWELIVAVSGREMPTKAQAEFIMAAYDAIFAMDGIELVWW